MIKTRDDLQDCLDKDGAYSDVAVNAHQDARYNPMSDGVHERKEWIY